MIPHAPEHNGCNARVYICVPQTLTEFKRRFWKSWRSVSLTMVQNLIRSMLGRLNTVIRNKGDTIP